jgi:uncharacterized membrane protein (DUF4010 family)
VPDLTTLVPPDATKIVLVLFLSFLIGLEREEHKATSGDYAFGGVRTFPLIGLLGYAVALLAGQSLSLVAIGFAVVAGFMLLSYWRKLTPSAAGGATSEISGLAIFIVGALVQHDYYWIPTTLVVVSLMLLELKGALESLATKVPPEEIFTFAKFLLLTAVILPVLPNTSYGPFNPFRAWVVVVAVSGVSYGSYLLQKITRGQGGILLAAVLGGAYSSTVMTVVLAKRAARERKPHLFAGGVLIASGMMYLRLAALVALFNASLARSLLLPFLVLAGAAILGGWLWSRVPDPGAENVRREFQPTNPLELRTALAFAALFIGMLVLTGYTSTHLGHAGIYSLGAVMGLIDVDPFIMGLTQVAGSATTPLGVAAAGILVAAASNNIAKGVYAFSLADRRTGVRSLVALSLLALAGLSPLVFGLF